MNQLDANEHPEPVVVRRYAHEWRAIMLKGELEAAGIPAWVQGGVTAGFRAEAPGEAIVSVRADDAARAASIADDFDNHDHTPSEAQPGEPGGEHA